METPTLHLDATSEVVNPVSLVEAALSRLQTSTDQLRQQVEEQTTRLDRIVDLLVEAPRPARSRTSTGGSRSVWCLPCGAVCSATDEACPSCSRPLRGLGQIAAEEWNVTLATPGGRFDARGWELLGACPLECPECLTPLQCAVKLYEARSGKQKYWALLCRGCANLRQVGGLWREQKDTLNSWARQQPLLVERASKEPARPLSSTLSTTLEMLRAGQSPDAIASSRGLALATIYGHLGLLVQLEHCALNQLIPSEVVESVVTAHERFPRPVDLADLESRLPLPMLRGDLNLVVQALNLEMGLGDPVEEGSRARVRSALRSAVGTYDGQLGARELLGMTLGTEAFRSGPFANRVYFGTLRGFSQDALSEELRALLEEGVVRWNEAKKLTLP